MEIARERRDGPERDGDLVEVAFVGDSGEGEIVRALLEGQEIRSYLQQTGVYGPTVGKGLLSHASQRVMVRRDQADAARRILDEALRDGDRNAEPETANSRYLERAAGRRGPRNYTVVGAYARAIFWSAAAFALVAAVFLLLRL